MKRLYLFGLVLALAMLSGCGSQPTETADLVGVIHYQTLPEFIYPTTADEGIGSSVIYLDDEKITCSTGDGTFRFKNVPLGVHTIQVKDAHHVSEKLEVNVTESGTMNIEIDAYIDQLRQFGSFGRNGDQEILLYTYFRNLYYENATSVKVVTDSVEKIVEAQDEVCQVMLTRDDGLLAEYGQSYPIEFTFYGQKGEEIGSISELIYFPELKVNLVTDGVDKPTIQLDVPEEGIPEDYLVEFELTLWTVNENGGGTERILSNIFKETTYTIDTPLSSRKYTAYIYLIVKDLAGKFIQKQRTLPVEFTWQNPTEELITFEDARLEEVIRMDLGKTGPISMIDTRNFNYLDGYGYQIESLGGLEHFTDLEYLALDMNRISDLSPVANLEKLTVLSVDANPVSDLTPLANLVNLEHLGLISTDVTDLTILASLTQLKGLSLISTPITNIDVLLDLSNLEKLYLGGNPELDLTEGSAAYRVIEELESRGVIVHIIL